MRENASTNGAKIYIDGVLEATGTVSGNLTGWSGNLRIGRNPENYSTALDGFISNFRITHSAVYTSAFTAPTAPFEDPTTNGELSVYFDQNGDALEAPSSSDFKFGTGDFTIEAWLYPTAATQQSYALVVKCAANSNWTGGWAIAFRNSPDNGKISFWINNAEHLGSSTALVPNAWNHIAVTRTGSTTNLYQNGTRVATGSSSYDFQPTNEMVIGSDNTHTAYEYLGYISNLRILKGEALYTDATYTVPTTPFTPVSITKWAKL